ncbi:UNVERIFIED_CONTAM: hypothetical protein Sindi_1720900, partial [Sesamum indicum]
MSDCILTKSFSGDTRRTCGKQWDADTQARAQTISKQRFLQIRESNIVHTGTFL